MIKFTETAFTKRTLPEQLLVKTGYMKLHENYTDVLVADVM
jgi:hypothetical protein